MSAKKQQKNILPTNSAEFDQQKAKSLSGIDNSKKGSVDEPIVDLVAFINNLDDFFTTSSCSGRIAVISEGDARKKGCNWLFMSHSKCHSSEIVNTINSTSDFAIVNFKYEAFVLHVQCKSLDKAQKMLQNALQAGFRNSGLVIGKKKRIMLAVRSTHAMEVPLVLKGKLMVSEEYITNIVDICNDKFEENSKRIDRFFDALKMTFSQ